MDEQKKEPVELPPQTSSDECVTDIIPENTVFCQDEVVKLPNLHELSESDLHNYLFNLLTNILSEQFQLVIDVAQERNVVPTFTVLQSWVRYMMNRDWNRPLAYADFNFWLQQEMINYTYFVATLPQNPQMDDGGKKKNIGQEKKEKRSSLHLRSSVKTFAIKFYIEQLENAGDTALSQFVALLNLFKTIVRCGDDLEIFAIIHHKDINNDNYWELAVNKLHVHLIGRTKNGKSTKISTILNRFGIKFRNGLDDDLWKNHGVETVKNMNNYLLYLTHETEQSIADGKETYDLERLISNVSYVAIEQYRIGYRRAVNSNARISNEMLEELDRQAEQLGFQLQTSFDDWWGSQSFNIRSHSKRKVIEESFNRGIDKRLLSEHNLNRMCLFLQDEPNTGKTHGSIHALLDMGLKVYTVDNGGTGKFDNLTLDHDAIILDDTTCYDILNITDNRICRLHRRNNNNPVWKGRIVIVTSNLDFAEWASHCGIRIKDDCGRETAQYRALKTRFAFATIGEEDGKRQLLIQQLSERGSDIDQLERTELLRGFKKCFDVYASSYTPNKKNDIGCDLLCKEAYIAKKKELAYQEYDDKYQQLSVEYLFTNKFDEDSAMIAYEEYKNKCEQLDRFDENSAMIAYAEYV